MIEIRFRSILIAGLFGLSAPGAHAQPAYPSQPTKIAVPFVPGSVVAREVPDRLVVRANQIVLLDVR